MALTAGNWVSLCSIFLLPHKPLLLQFCSGYFSLLFLAVFCYFFSSALSFSIWLIENGLGNKGQSLQLFQIGTWFGISLTSILLCLAKQLLQ